MRIMKQAIPLPAGAKEGSLSGASGIVFIVSCTPSWSPDNASAWTLPKGTSRGRGPSGAPVRNTASVQGFELGFICQTPTVRAHLASLSRRRLQSDLPRFIRSHGLSLKRCEQPVLVESSLPGSAMSATRRIMS